MLSIDETPGSASKGQRVALRVPVLYGPCPKPSDSAVNILLDIVRDQSGKTYKMGMSIMLAQLILLISAYFNADHWATRYPTNVEDIAAFLVQLVGE